MDLIQQFSDFIRLEKLFRVGDHWLLGVSGGVDSVSLCELCKICGYPFSIAHANFQLRGSESLRDEQFVRDLAKKYNVRIYVKQFDTHGYAQANHLSIQTAARDLRYAWFDLLLDTEFGLAKSPNEAALHSSTTLASCLATAHHLDDNVETVLMHLFRGTGITGLKGMLPKQGRIVRPLLFAAKSQLLAFAASRGLSWVEDSSNVEEKYTRNNIRLRVIPAIESIYPTLLSNMAGNMNRFKEIEELYIQAIGWHKKRLLEYRDDECVYVSVLKLKKSQPLQTVCFEVVRDFGFTSAQVDEVIALLDSATGKYLLSGTHRILKNRQWLIISPHIASPAQVLVAESDQALLAGPDFTMKISSFAAGRSTFGSNPMEAFLNAAEIKFPLLVRKWKAGDYFYPLGMRKKKKLARFFIDLKLSKPEKENIWVVESQRKIIWIAGRRIDDRFKVNPDTRRILKIEMRMN